MQRTGFLALGAVLLALGVAPQANAAIGVATAPRVVATEVHHVTLDRLFERDRKHKKLKHYKHHKKHKHHQHHKKAKKHH